MTLTKRQIFEVTDLSGREPIMRVTGGMKAIVKIEDEKFKRSIGQNEDIFEHFHSI
jgi:hypothetical protein